MMKFFVLHLVVFEKKRKKVNNKSILLLYSNLNLSLPQYVNRLKQSIHTATKSTGSLSVTDRVNQEDKTLKNRFF